MESTLRDGPNPQRYVFFRALKTIDGVVLTADGEAQEFAENTGYLISYDKIKDHVLSGDVELR